MEKMNEKEFELKYGKFSKYFLDLYYVENKKELLNFSLKRFSKNYSSTILIELMTGVLAIFASINNFNTPFFLLSLILFSFCLFLLMIESQNIFNLKKELISNEVRN